MYDSNFTCAWHSLQAVQITIDTLTTWCVSCDTQVSKGVLPDGSAYLLV